LDFAWKGGHKKNTRKGKQNRVRKGKTRSLQETAGGRTEKAQIVEKKDYNPCRRASRKREGSSEGRESGPKKSAGKKEYLQGRGRAL